MGAAGARVPTRPLGHVTSSYLSATLGRSIAMGLLAGGRARMGETLYVATERGEVAVEVTARVFYDPSGARIHG
jgi:sarcosine oxidase subunit alpha